MWYTFNIWSGNLNTWARKKLVPLRVIQEGSCSNEEKSTFYIFRFLSQNLSVDIVTTEQKSEQVNTQKNQNFFEKHLI